jgi:hypothetical protein
VRPSLVPPEPFTPRFSLSFKTTQFCLLACALLTVACGAEVEPLTTPSPSQQVDEVAPAPQNDAAPVATIASNDTTAPAEQLPGNPEEPPVTAPPAEEPPVTEPPADEPPVTPPAPEEPPVTAPPAEEPPSTTPPEEPTPGTPVPSDPNAGWTTIAQGTRRATFPQGQTGPGTTGAAFTTSIPAARIYRLKYEVMPEGNFDFRAGGKLPGLGGGSTPSGGSQATDGYSARLMWNHGGRLSFYFYRVTGGVGGIDTGGYGTHWMWAADAKLVPGQWNTIELAIDMNTGLTIGSLNGVEKGRQTLNYLWNTTDKIVFSAFFGGQGASYEPSKNEAMSFRNMAVKAGD